MAIRECAVITAGAMIQQMAENNAKVDFDGDSKGWSPEFAEWYRARSVQYLKEARLYLNEEADCDEIDDHIQDEIDEWRD
ncbi:hypothetical protein D8682_26255 [Buttiauxella sp. 3AFRM03]|uniref:hypothetical protein n=1 Tax=Buttiauxella sp. 3AFRM03 TaxID=2479367 RepID=UPI000EF7C4B3|nr:hypothetical protein [Buttiauxella sp. 3AFRM03]AYN30175.1 hypothetical protein D8682_26255 [Buttiauxella sp. 3AFRM03]